MKKILCILSAGCFMHAAIYAQTDWHISGNNNTSPSTNFLGTTDNKAFAFRTNNTERMRIQANGQIGIKNNINIDSGFALYMANHRVLSTDSLRGNTYLGNGISVNTFAYYNTASGYQSLHSNYTGSANTANGYQALFANSYGVGNTASGYQSLFNNSGSYNSAQGYQALYFNSGVYNTANGYQALYSNSTGRENVAIGPYALYNNSTGSDNTATGVSSLDENTTGIFNTADGGSALFTNTAGSYNTASGYSALYNNTTGNYNVAVGYWALNQNYDAYNNTAIGTFAGTSTHGWNNTFIGSGTNVTASDIYNSTALGNNVLVTASNQVRIGNNFVTSIGGFANWTNISDGRVKKNIKENVPGLAFINKLKPVTYNLDLDAADKIVQRPAVKDKDGKLITQKPSPSEINARNEKEQKLYTGFVAQDVEKAAKELNYDFSGVDAAKNDKSLYGLRYSEFVVPLVKAVQELSKMHKDADAKIDSLQKQINELKAMLHSPSGAEDLQNEINTSSATLEQNIPNPLTSATSIHYNIPAGSSTASLRIINNNGNTVKQISLSGNGKGVVNIEASTLSAGTYSYVLIVDGKTIATKKMVIAR